MIAIDTGFEIRELSMLFLMTLKLQSVNQARLSCTGKSAATPRHFTRRYCFCQYLFIIDDYFPAFSM